MKNLRPRNLRPLSPRPELVVDEQGRPLRALVPPSLPGLPGPFGRDRVVAALPTQARTLVPPRVIADQDGIMLADRDGVVVGVPGIVVHRMVSAGRTTATRRF